MKKTFEKEEDELKELLELEIQAEALQIEKLLSEEDLDDFELTEEETEESFQNLVQKLKDDGVYRSDDQSTGKVIPFTHNNQNMIEPEREETEKIETEKIEEKQATQVVEEAGSERTIAKEQRTEEKALDSSAADSVVKIEKIRKKSFPFAKVAGFMVVAILSVFAGSMTSEANRQYLVKRFQYLNGDKFMIVSDNDTNVDWSLKDEVEAIKKIETELKIKIPDLLYRPYLEFSSYYLDEKEKYAYFKYTYTKNNTKMTIYFINQSDNSSSFAIRTHGDRTIELPFQNIKTYVKEITNSGSESAYEAMWRFENSIYRINGRIEWKEFEKIIQGITFSE